MKYRVMKPGLACFAVGMFLFDGDDAKASEFTEKYIEKMVKNESFYRPRNLIVRYGQFTYYVSETDSSALKWLAFGLDLFNPVDDVVTYTDIGESIVVAIKSGEAYDNFWDFLQSDMKQVSEEDIKRMNRLSKEEGIKYGSSVKQEGFFKSIYKLLFE